MKGIYQVRQTVIPMPWPAELARDWLELDHPQLSPALPQNVRRLLEIARPRLVSSLGSG